MLNLSNLPFLKKKEQSMTPGKGYAPVERIKELAGRGFSEPEMIDVLRREGFGPDEIDNALTHALRVGVNRDAGMPQQLNPPAEQTSPRSELPTLEQLLPQGRQEQPLQVPETSLPQQSAYEHYAPEDYIDAIVQARMGDVEDRINEFSLKSQQLEKEMQIIHDQLNDVLKARTSQQQQILERIDDFREAVTDVTVRIGSLEKAFKDTLPALIESVRALSDIVQMMKRQV